MEYSTRREFGGRRMRRVLLAGTAFLALGLALGTSAALAQIASVSLPEQPLAQSLKDVARQTGENILFTPDAVAGFRGHALLGQMTAQQAVNALIAGTGLEAVSDGNGGLIVRKAHSKNARAASNGEAGNPEEVIVTGTHIRGEGPVGSEVITYSRQDLDQSGSITLDQFARQMPENLSNTDGIANVFSKNQLAAHSGGDANNNAGTAFNLGGLGVDATLTLVDGHRVASSGSIGSFVDISMIPFSAVDHLEVLADGASSIYGSDAVGGVVNIIMRKDYDGAESSVRYGGSTDGGADEITLSQLVGKAWSTGNVMLNYEYDHQTGLDAAQRSYIPDQGGPASLIPKTQRMSLFFTGNQQIDSDTTISGEAIYSHKNIFLANTITSLSENESVTQPGSVSQTGGTLSVDRKLWSDWDASLTGNYSAINQVFNQQFVLSIPPIPPFFPGLVESGGGPQNSQTKTWGIHGLANGTVLSLPGGDVKAAVGASYRAESYQVGTIYTVNGFTTPYIYPTYSRHVESVFGEVHIPVIGDGNALPFVQHLDISAAVRYDDYSDFGSTTNPKVGLSWEPTDDLKLRGTWGTSYRAPLLVELDNPINYQAEYLPDSAVPGGQIYAIDEGGGNPNLKPETAKVISGGADWEPHWVKGLKLSATFTRVDYTNLIGIPPVTNFGAVFSDPVLAPYITYNPSLAVTTAAFNSPGFQGDTTGMYNPAAIKAIFNQQDTNLASEVESTLDLRATYALPTDIGQFTLQGVVDHFITDTLQTARGTPEFQLLDTFGEPLRWKSRGSVMYTDDGFAAGVTINYANSYSDSLTTPHGTIASWTTADLYLGCALGSDGGGLLENFRVSLTMQNIFDTKPPYVLFPSADLLPGQNPVPFDPVNGSPMGRFIAIQLTKDF